MTSIIRRAASALSPFVPPIVQRPLKAFVNRNAGAYSGNFASWAEATRSAEGYDSQIILEKVRASLLKVKNGEARGERDSVIFDEPPYSYPVIAALLRSALRHDGALHVVDFGGSLGTSYFQFRAFAPPLRRLEWSIVEQPHFVACGRRDFEDDVLKFYDTVADSLRGRPAQVLLLASVLTYLPDPYRFLAQLMSHGFETIIVERTLFHDGASDRLCVQKVPAHIYPASYPAWLFGRAKFLATLDREYEKVGEFQAEHTPDFELVASKCLGFIFDRRSARQ